MNKIALNLGYWAAVIAVAALAFESGRTEKIIKFSLLANGVMMLISAVGYVFDLTIILFFLMNIGMGAAVLTATVYLSKLFRKKLRQSTI